MTRCKIPKLLILLTDDRASKAAHGLRFTNRISSYSTSNWLETNNFLNALSDREKKMKITIHKKGTSNSELMFV